MEKRLLLAMVLSVAVLLFWSLLFTPKSTKRVAPQKIIQEVKPKEFIEYETPYILAKFNSQGELCGFLLKEKRKDWPDLIGNEFVISPKLSGKVNFLKMEDGITFLHSSEEIEVKRIYKFYPKYLNKLILIVRNKTEKEKQLKLNLLWRGGLGGDSKRKKQSCRETKPIAVTKESDVYRVKKLKKGKIDIMGEWIGLHNNYFLLAFFNPERYEVFVTKKKFYNIELSKAVNLRKLEEKRVEFEFYLGPKDKKILESYSRGLEASIMYGIFGGISKLAFLIVNFFYGLTKNYGLAVVMLAVMIQILFFPLTSITFKSSKRMKKIQPQLKLIQQVYQKDPRRMQQEIMLLYKRHKVNPFSGCLPLFIQLPIFIGLFSMLTKTYELRGANFILWLNDLSLPDQFYILPILMGISIFFQQRMTGLGTDPSQKIFSYFMPIFITVIFLTMPSGLVLYWLASNVVSLIEYSILGRVIS